MKKYTLSVLALAAALSATPSHAGENKKKEEKTSEVFCDAPAPKTIAPGPQGWAVSLAGGLMMMDSKLTHENGFDLKYKNNFKRLGLGIAHYWTLSNRVVWGLGLDVFAGFGTKKVDSQMTIKVIHPINGLTTQTFDAEYSQKRPISAVAFSKLGYAYGNFTPFLMLGIRESYVKHQIISKATGAVTTEKDVNFSVTPGLGFMYKMGPCSVGVEYMRGGESTFGLDGYADKVRNKTQSVVARVSYFF